MLLMEAKGYKVCRKVNGKYYSLYEGKPAKLEFRKGIWTMPNPECGPITVFPKLRHAQFLKLCSSERPNVLLEIRYIPSKANAVANLYRSVSLPRLEEINYKILIPGATKLAQAVKVVKVLK